MTRARTVLEIATGAQPSRRPRRRYEEFETQKMYAAWLRLHVVLRDTAWTATMQGINLPKLQAQLARAKGVQRGVPDFLHFEPRRLQRGLALEFKASAGGKLSGEQRGWLEHLKTIGWRVECPTSFDEARRITLEYYGLER